MEIEEGLETETAGKLIMKYYKDEILIKLCTVIIVSQRYTYALSNSFELY